MGFRQVLLFYDDRDASITDQKHTTPLGASTAV